MLHSAAFFEPNPDIRRVVTIGTPHHGSDLANDATRWISRKLITLPTMMVSSAKSLISQNPGLFRNADLLLHSTSIDSLSPSSPLFPVILRAPKAPWVVYNNILGAIPEHSWFGEDKPATGDGVVSLVSAHVDDAESEINVNSEHQSIHRHPKAILEVRRILLAHLEQVKSEYRVAQRLASSLDSTRVPANTVAASISDEAND